MAGKNKNDVVSREEQELGTSFLPKFDDSGLIPCITVDDATSHMLMVAWMNREALEQTLETRKATYYSRSRKKIWVKGEQSGRYQHVQEMRVDCDQDVLQLRVRVSEGGACHQGYRSCFYRSVKPDHPQELTFNGEPRIFDPADVYGEDDKSNKKDGESK
ncbi:MAG: phosphoribosyl-AMP cyclohydrolase [Balneolaceae bacterium]